MYDFFYLCSYSDFFFTLNCGERGSGIYVPAARHDDDDDDD